MVTKKERLTWLSKTVTLETAQRLANMTGQSYCMYANVIPIDPERDYGVVPVVNAQVWQRFNGEVMLPEQEATRCGGRS